MFFILVFVVKYALDGQRALRLYTLMYLTPIQIDVALCRFDFRIYIICTVTYLKQSSSMLWNIMLLNNSYPLPLKYIPNINSVYVFYDIL